MSIHFQDFIKELAGHFSQNNKGEVPVSVFRKEIKRSSLSTFYGKNPENYVRQR